jgi:hypothetical protein
LSICWRMKPGKILNYVILAVVAANLAIVAVVFLPALSSKPTPLPNPNGYDDFVKAGRLLDYQTLDYTTLDRQGLMHLISDNEATLKLLRSGLSHESRVPDNYSKDYITGVMTILPSFKQCVFVLCAEGKLAQLEGRTNDAAKIYLDAIRFGQESSRGGVLINRLVGIACENLGLRVLQPLSQSLDARQCADVARTLEGIDAKEEPIAEMFAHEKIYISKVSGLRERFAELVSYRSLQATKKRVTEKVNANTKNRRQVMVDFAARAYELDKGRRAASLAELVPAYLKAVPVDPVTGKSVGWAP